MYRLQPPNGGLWVLSWSLTVVILAKACTVQQRVCRSGKPMAIATVLLSMFNNLVNQVRSPKTASIFYKRTFSSLCPRPVEYKWRMVQRCGLKHYCNAAPQNHIQWNFRDLTAQKVFCNTRGPGGHAPVINSTSIKSNVSRADSRDSKL